jgi:putative transposase
VERWFALITNPGDSSWLLDSAIELKRKIHEYVEHYNQHPRPFKWIATADSTLAKIERLY